MFKSPFVWKSLHLALLAAKDEQIKSLREELYVARSDRLRAETARDVSVKQTIEALTPKPAVVPAPARFMRRDHAEPHREPETLDLAEVDPTDSIAIRDLAIREMPAGKTSASHLLQKMESIRAQAFIAKAAKRERSKEVGVLSAPEAVMAKIEAAEQAGREQARVQ